MGEFITIDGEEVKIGTCENIDVLTYAELQKLFMFGRANAEVSSYLDPEHGFRYRFPFPNEVGMSYDERRKALERFDMVPEPTGFWAKTSADDHYSVHVYHKWPDGAGTSRARLVCPNSPLGVSVWEQPTIRMVGISQQKQVEGRLWTVVTCPYCRASWRLEMEEATNMCKRMLKCFVANFHTSEPFSYYEELARVVMLGYGLKATADFASESAALKQPNDDVLENLINSFI